MDFDVTAGDVEHDLKNNRFDFGGEPDRLDPGIFPKTLQHCYIGPMESFLPVIPLEVCAL